MKFLFEQTDRGYSWSNPHRYYLCENEEEYNSMIEKYKDHSNGHYEYRYGYRIWIQSYEQVSIGDISATPQTIVSDGYAVSGGHNFKAKGITIKYCSFGQNDYSSYNHYIKPDSIVKNEIEKAQGWWV